jgi:hypothetical protein
MSAQRYTPDIIARAEELVSRIKGISSCKISADETGEITEVHVVATAQKYPKLIARDVESCLKAELGIHVDYKKIGVVIFDSKEHLNSEDETFVRGEEQTISEFPIEEHPARFAFKSVNLFISQDSVHAEVELVRQGLEVFGSATSANPASSPLRVIAEATLKAVGELLDDSIRLCLCDVVEVPLAESTALVVKVDLLQNRVATSLAGCCLFSGNVNQTVVFTTLDAVNRVFGKLKTRSSIEYKIE